MKNRHSFPHLFLVCLVLLLSAPIAASHTMDNESGLTSPVLTVSDTIPWWKKHLRASTESMLFVRHLAFQDGTTSVNPENRVAALNSGLTGLYLRPSIKGQWEKATFWVKPRLNLDYSFQESSLGTEAHLDTDAFFQMAKGQAYLSDALSVTAGRYVRETGVSSFVNPHNPFLVFSSLLNPKIEQRPSDFIEMSLMTRTAGEISVIANLGRQEDPFYTNGDHTFYRGYAISGEYYGDAISAGATTYLNENGRFQAGGYLQSTVSEAVILWADAVVKYKPERYYPASVTVPGSASERRILTTGVENERTFFTGLVGGSYTFEAGPTAKLEYYHNGEGYDQDDAVLLQTIMDAGAGPFTNPMQMQLHGLNMSRIISPGMAFLRKNYLFLELNQQDLFDFLDYNLRFIHGLDDGSVQVSGILESRLGGVNIFLIGLKNFGHDHRELSRLSRTYIMLGATHFLR